MTPSPPEPDPSQPWLYAAEYGWDWCFEVGYRRIRLWTNSILVAALAIYQARGYRLLESAPHTSFGHALVGKTWELAL